jgi:hypothetical protein
MSIPITLIEQGHIWSFPGGIHPPERKGSLVSYW